MVAPQDIKELKSFLGLCGWFGQFIPHMSTLLEPFRSLTPSGAVWSWTALHQAAFERIRKLIIHAPALVHRIDGHEVTLRSDASSVGIAAVFFQRNPASDEWSLLAAFSRTLSHAERAYSTIELEALAIVWGVSRARSLCISKLIIITDHSNLQFMRSSINQRVQRWAVILSEFDYTIVWAPGRDNSVSDFLSRALVLQDGEEDVPVVELHVVETEDE
jgi:hypothetical protein